jgi:hypothetical protein
MILALERASLIQRRPHIARSIELLIAPQRRPPLLRPRTAQMVKSPVQS